LAARAQPSHQTCASGTIWTTTLEPDKSHIWQFMRDNWLSNRVFTSYDNLVDHCCAAWNKLVDQPWTIMFIGLHDWAHGC